MVNWCKRALDCLGGDSFRTRPKREKIDETITTSGNNKKVNLQLKLLAHQEPLNTVKSVHSERSHDPTRGSTGETQPSRKRQRIRERRVEREEGIGKRRRECLR